MIEERRKRQRQLLALFAIAFATLGSAYVLYYFASEGGVWRTTNHGEFVSPPLTADELDLRDAAGDRPDTAGTWWLWVVAADGCAASCRTALHQLRQLHVLLNKDAPRLRRALLARPGADAPARGEYPEMLRLSGAFEKLADGIYIIDPIGNLVLVYPHAAPGAHVLEDLKRLLRVSRIG